jgi:hypothetical protein
MPALPFIASAESIMHGARSPSAASTIAPSGFSDEHKRTIMRASLTEHLKNNYRI